MTQPEEFEALDVPLQVDYAEPDVWRPDELSTVATSGEPETIGIPSDATNAVADREIPAELASTIGGTIDDGDVRAAQGLEDVDANETSAAASRLESELNAAESARSTAGDSAYTDREGAIQDGPVGQAAMVAGLLGVPGADRDVNLIGDVVDGNSGAIVGDAAAAATETGMSIAGAAIGSTLGPVGTIMGSEVGNFLGDAVAPSVEDGITDVGNTVSDVWDNSEAAVDEASSDFADGDLLGGIGDVVSGTTGDLGDLVGGAADVIGDAADGIGDVAGEVADGVSDAVGDAASDAVDDVSNAADDVADDVGGAVSDIGDDLSDLF